MKDSCYIIITALLLLTTRTLSSDPDLHGDANIYASVVQALRELEHGQKSQGAEVQHASSVCYDDLGCFDKDGTFKHLKQLPEPPETVNTHFLLYTRQNKLIPQLLDHRKPETVTGSNLNPSVPLKFITHGFGGKNNLTWVWEMKNALLEKQDLNVICVDWSLGARIPYYIQAAVNSELVGAEVAVLYYLIKDRLGIQEKDLHLIGFSLGAQVVGFVGKRMQEMRGTKPGRITGLDPASPLFEEYGGEVHLWRDDGDFVDVVHTNADLLMYGGVGMGIPIGDVDFFPNGGKRQPGCGSTIVGAFIDIFKGDRARACNHERAVHLFIDSILEEGCSYVGYKCTNYTEFSGAKCMGCGNDCGKMGYSVTGNGTYYLMTKAKKPFCSEIAKVVALFDKETKKSYGAITVTLVGSDGAEENITLTEKDEKLLAGANKTLAFPLEGSTKDPVEVRILYVRFNGWIAKGTMTFELESVAIVDSLGRYIFRTCEKTPILLQDNEYKTLNRCPK